MCCLLCVAGCCLSAVGVCGLLLRFLVLVCYVRCLSCVVVCCCRVLSCVILVVVS